MDHNDHRTGIVESFSQKCCRAVPPITVSMLKDADIAKTKSLISWITSHTEFNSAQTLTFFIEQMTDYEAPHHLYTVKVRSQGPFSRL